MYFLISLFLAGPLFGQKTDTLDPGTVVLRVGSQQVTQAEFERLAMGMGLDVSKDSPDAKRNVGQQVGAMIALAEEARARKVDQEPKVAGRLRVQRERLLGSMLFEYVLADIRKDEAAVRKYYATHPPVAEERKIRQILVRFRGPGGGAKRGQERPEAEALERVKMLRSKIVAGADFAEVARSESDDEKTAPSGGDLGVQHRGVFLAEFETTAFALPEGRVSEPVKTRDGFHLILVEKIVSPKFEEVRKSVEYQMARERIAALATRGVELSEDYFGKPR